MAIIYCHECKKEMSDTLSRCPHCGYEMLKQKETNNNSIENKSKKIVALVVVTVIITVVALGFANLNYRNLRQEKIAAAEKIIEVGRAVSEKALAVDNITAKLIALNDVTSKTEKQDREYQKLKEELAEILGKSVGTINTANEFLEWYSEDVRKDSLVPLQDASIAARDLAELMAGGG